MVANFWTSSHCKQLMDKDEIPQIHSEDQELGYTAEEVKLVKTHLAQLLKMLAQQVKVRQRVVATAICYFRRIYVKRSFAEFDPRVVAPTCLYLASKAEESTVQAKLLVFYIKKLCPFAVEIKDVLEMEMRLLEALNFHLVVFHPYRPLMHFVASAGLGDLTQSAWSMINDSYMTDICLSYPPHLIALAAIYLVSVVRERDVRAFFEDLNINMKVIRDIMMVMLDYYDNYRQPNLGDEVALAALKKLPAR